MNPVVHNASLLCAAGCVLTIFLVVPLIMGWIPRNYFYGVRTRRSLQGSEAEWYAINRKGGWILFWISLCIFVIAVSFLLIYR